jgi:translation initiation factor 2 beta subunit (eIF-2beta)/eIF-5
MIVEIKKVQSIEDSIRYGKNEEDIKWDLLFGGLKKKKKKIQYDFGIKRKKVLMDDINECTYTYKELVERIYEKINEKEVKTERKYNMVPPIIKREGSKKTAFENIVEMTKRMNRPTEHLVNYIVNELSIMRWSMDGNNRLLMRGRYQQPQIETLIIKYIREYIRCKSCKDTNTIMYKENRLLFIECKKCLSKYSISEKNGLLEN